MRHIIPISGKDSLCAALLQTASEPDLEYEYFFTDTGMELPETYEWLALVENRLGWHIHRIGASLEALIMGYGVLPSHNMRFCTRETKIEPMEKWLGEDDATIYYGLRADETRTGYRPSKKGNLVVRYPLREMNIGLSGVWTILEAKDLLPPAFFWNSLYYRTLELLYPFESWVDQLKPWELRMLFAWRSRSNCFSCFYQRQYEWLALSEFHPDLFWKAVRMEMSTGARGYTFRQGYFLEELLPRRKEIIDKRAREIVTLLYKRVNGSVFDEAPTLLDAVGCGLLCGK